MPNCPNRLRNARAFALLIAITFSTVLYGAVAERQPLYRSGAIVLSMAAFVVMFVLTRAAIIKSRRL